MIRIIDHHTYGTLDRLNDPHSRLRNKSSLEQFLDEAGITDEELREWGYEPKVVRGLGIFDDRFAQGLRDEGYASQEIAAVIALSTGFSSEMNPSFEEIAKAAEEDWKNRELWRGYVVVRSDFRLDVRGAISHIMIREGVDARPHIISSCSGKKIFVQQVDPSVVERLQHGIPPENTFTYGAGRCWGYDAKMGPVTVKLDQVLKALETDFSQQI